MNTLAILLAHYFLGLLFACTIELWWFRTSFVVHLTKFLRWLGWRKNRPELWPEQNDYKFWYFTAWKKWLVETSQLPVSVVQGLICPGCMSLHVSWVAALPHSLILSCVHTWWWGIAFLLAAVSSWPAIVMVLIAKMTDFDKRGTHYAHFDPNNPIPNQPASK